MEVKNVRKNFQSNKCPLCLEQENEIHIILECKAKEEVRERWVDRKILGCNRKLALQKLLNSNNEKVRINLGKILYFVKSMWVEEIEGMAISMENSFKIIKI